MLKVKCEQVYNYNLDNYVIQKIYKEINTINYAWH